MKVNIRTVATAVALAASTLLSNVALAGEPLHLLSRTDLPGYDGDFDHFGADIKGNRLFLAGEDGGRGPRRQSQGCLHVLYVLDARTKA